MKRAVCWSVMLWCMACDTTQPVQEVTPPTKTLQTPVKEAPKAPPVTYSGEGPVKTGPSQVLFEHNDMRVEVPPRKVGETTGKAWRVRLPRKSRYRVLSEDILTAIDEMRGIPKHHGALINGGFYEKRGEGYGPMGIVIQDGASLSPYRRRGGSGIFAVLEDEGPTIVHHKKWKDLKGKKPTQVIQSIDRIVDAGKSLVRLRPEARRAARSAVALDKDHVWLIVTAANRSLQPRTNGARLVMTSFLGMTLGEFAQYLIDDLGVTTALNLDGAVSTALRVTTPSHTLHLRGERGVLQGLWVGP